MQSAESMLQAAIELMESTANMLRGMTMDPAIPAHAKEAMRSRIANLETSAQEAAAFLGLM
jgi:uncharacterized protein (UPF0147 family)